MSEYSIVVTAQHDAVDYDFFRKAADRNNFMFQIERSDPEQKRRTMVITPYQATTALNLFDMVNELDRNVPLLVTYVVCE
jgi:hypothetical protein